MRISNLEFYKKINLITLKEEDLFLSIKTKLQNIYDIVSIPLSEYFIDLLFSRFLSIAEKREIITKQLIDNLWIKINENMGRQQEFFAYKEGLISIIDWKEDKRPVDFYDGKRVRPGHIKLNLDIKRSRWLKQIKKAINGTNICIIRASSGQGKSTLLYRYAYEYWNDKYIYILKSVHSYKEVELIKDFLNCLKELNIPIILLIDNANFQTALWPEIAGFCASKSITVLITIRYEDWFRFNNPEITNYEIIQPDLNLEEAAEIYNIFLKQNKIHSNVNSYQDAFEKIGKPYLLIEYIYLLTHGEMLKERLERQIKHISELNEDKVKIELLRLISTADLLGVPVTIEKILNKIQFNSDLQILLESLKDEYIDIKENFVSGMHWVRSQHLSEILHNQVFHLTDTAIKLLELITENNIPYFISNCIIHQNIDANKILNFINNNIVRYSLKEIEQILKGLFLGGEKKCFLENRKIFEEAFTILGYSGIDLIGISCTPINFYNALDELEDIKTTETIQKLKAALSQFKDNGRGKDLCCQFAGLCQIDLIISKFHNKEMLIDASDIFYWLELAKIKIDTSFFIDFFSNIEDFDSIDEKAIYKLLSGLYQYNPETYFKWYERCKDQFHSYLQYKTDTLELKLENNELTIQFIEFENKITQNEQAVSRLNKYREALPFCTKYSSIVLHILPFGLEPSIKSGNKNIPVKNLPLKFYSQLNRYWLDIIENAFEPDSYYLFEKNHFELRQKIIEFLSLMLSIFKKLILGQKLKYDKTSLYGNLFSEIINLIDKVSKPPHQTTTVLKENFKKSTDKAQIHLRNFIYQLAEYFEKNREKDIGRLALHNLKEYREHLSMFYSGFEILFSIITDYFQFPEVKNQEMNYVDELVDLFEFYINNWKHLPIYTYKDQIENNKKLFHTQIISNVKKALADKNIISAEQVFIEFPISYLPIYYSIKNPFSPGNELLEICSLLNKNEPCPSFYYLIPLFNNHRIIDGGYRISSSIDKNDNAWESLCPHEIPEKIMALLPVKEKIQLKEYNFKEDLLTIIALISMWLKQLNLKVNGTNNCYIQKLADKITELYITTHKELKIKLSDLYNNYFSCNKELQETFIELGLNNIFQFCKDFSEIEKFIDAVDFLNKNSKILESIINYFTQLTN